MPPVGAFIATLITSASVAAASAAFVAAGGWLAVGTFILTQVVLWGVGKLLAPKQNRGGERQADTLTLSLGENPREAVFGQVATGGQLVDCWNHDSGNGDGRKNRAEVLVIKLADHEVDSLVGFYVNDEYYAFAGDGDVAAFYISGWGPGLQVYFRAGSQTQTPPSAIVSTSGGKWTNAKTMLGCAHVFVRYFDNKERTIFPGGRPRFSWVVKGAKLYDPRKDSTVAGGSGAHRWGTPTTYEWSENAYLIRYNWARGIYNGTQLMVGRGLTEQEAPPDRAISRANICDEAVTLKAGGTEPRYRAGGVIKSSDASIDVEEWLAAAMAGLIVDRDGVVDIDPGAAQSTVFSITDADMIAGREIQYSPHLNENQRLNTVVARWIDPAQRYADVSTAPRKVTADITADGRPYDVTIDLPFVLSGTQAQRIAEIRRRQGRLERVFSIPLGPKFIGLETGDWLAVQSDRYLGGATITGVATAVSLGDDFQVQVAIREINSNVYAWTAATDEQTKGTVLAASTAAPGAIVVDTFTAVASTLATAAGTDPAIYCTWLSFEDGAVSGIEFQVRKNGDTKVTTTLVEDTTSLQAFVTAGVGAQGSFDIRARGVARVPGRTSTWTGWTTVTTGGSSFNNDLLPTPTNNLVRYSNMEKGVAGYVVDNADAFTSPTLSTGVTNGKPWVKISATCPANNKAITLRQITADAFICEGNQKLSCEVEFEGTGTVNYVYALLFFYNAVDSLLTVGTIDLKSTPLTFGTKLRKADYVVPNNTTIAKATVAIVANCNTGAMSLTLTRPLATTRISDLSPVPPYAPGPNNQPKADETGSNRSAGLRPGASLLQTDGSVRQLPFGVEEVLMVDGGSYTFATPYLSPPKAKVLQGGLRTSAGLTGSQVQVDTFVISTTGAVASLKNKELVGATTPQTQTTWTTISSVRREAEKPTVGDAFDNQYKFDFSVNVFADFTGFEFDIYPGYSTFYGWATVTAYTNDGSGWVSRGSITLDYSTTASGYVTTPQAATIAGSITFTGAAIGQHAGREFAVEITARSNTSSVFAGSNSASYSTATAPASAARTTANEKVLVRFEQGTEV